jgi:hypothetical protein
MSIETYPEGFFLYISSAIKSENLMGFEWEGSRCLILIIVLRENLFHTSDILDDNSFGQTG